MYSMRNYVYTVSWVLNKIIDTLNTSCLDFVFTISINKNIWCCGPACSWATRWWSFSWWPQHVVEGGSVEVSGISVIEKDEFTDAFYLMSKVTYLVNWFYLIVSCLMLMPRVLRLSIDFTGELCYVVTWNRWFLNEDFFPNPSHWSTATIYFW